MLDNIVRLCYRFIFMGVGGFCFLTASVGFVLCGLVRGSHIGWSGLVWPRLAY